MDRNQTTTEAERLVLTSKSENKKLELSDDSKVITQVSFSRTAFGTPVMAMQMMFSVLAPPRSYVADIKFLGDSCLFIE